jgi:hypothetical protein
VQKEVSGFQITKGWVYGEVVVDRILAGNAVNPVTTGIAVDVTACENGIGYAHTMDSSVVPERDDCVVDSG